MLLTRHFAIAGLASLPFFSSQALAAPCVGFGDADDSDAITGPFCTNVAWIKNRGVTLGCSTAPLLYCPSGNVTRLQMAAFMQRLGDALTPTVLTNTLATGPVDLDLSIGSPSVNVCRTAPFAVTDYPRRAIIHAQFSGLAAGPLQIYGTATYSTNNATSFQDVVPGGIGVRNSVGAAGWVLLSQVTRFDMEVGQTYIFAFQVERAAGTTGPNDLTDGRCNITVSIGSRTGVGVQADADAQVIRDNSF